MTALKELFSACEISTQEVCFTCAPKLCQDCPNTLKNANEDILRDRIVVGIHDDDTRHKLLAHEHLTLMDGVRICRSEEAAKHAGDGIPQPAGSSAHASVSAVKRSTYQRQKQTTQPKLNVGPDLVSYVTLSQLWSWTSCEVGMPGKWQEMQWLQRSWAFCGVLPEEEEIAAWL